MINIIKEKLNGIGINPKDIICCACADLNRESNMSFSFIALTDSKIIKIENSSVFKQLNAAPYCDADAQITLFDRALCDNFKSNFNVSGITLTMKYDGQDVLLCHSTNRFMPQIRVLEYAASQNRILPIKQDGNLIENLDFGKKESGNGITLIKRTSKYFIPYKKKVALIFLFVFLTSAVGIITPYLSGRVLFGQIFEGNKVLGGLINSTAGNLTFSLLIVVLIMLAIELFNQFTYAAHAYITAHITPFVMKDIKSDIFKKMSSLSIGFYHSRRTGALITRVLDDADRVSNVLIDHAPYVIIDIITILAVSAIMLVLNWKLALAAIILMPISILITSTIMPRLFSLHGRQHRARNSMTSRLNDNLTGARVVKAFGQEEKEKARFSYYSQLVKTSEINIVKSHNRIFALFQFVKQFSTLFIYILGGYIILSKSGEFDYATLVTFTGYAAQLANPIENLSHIFRVYSDFTNASQRIFEILDTPPQIKQAEKPIHLENPKGEVEFCNVTFSYETGKPVLHDVSFRAQSGQLLGIVGYSGAGKTTLLNIISRLYDADSGCVKIDGVDIKDIAFDDLRRLIAVVSQETYIFMGTVAENIAYANPDATREEIISAAVSASAHDFIMKLPDGYDTVIGASGQELSGGERQRLSIARAILANPKILILDEATSAVDTKTEINIQAAIDKLAENRTTISVAHRLSTLRNADNLIVIDKGKVIESGTHEQLIQQKGLYFQLATLQTQQMIMKGEENHDRKPRQFSQ